MAVDCSDAIGKAVYAVRGKRRREKQEANSNEATTKQAPHFVVPCSEARKLRLDEAILLRPFTGSRLSQNRGSKAGLSTVTYNSE